MPCPTPKMAPQAPRIACRTALRLAALETALADLPDRQRQAVVLRHIEGLTNPRSPK
jgi:DNA-directed RNA polymerase specialized sigma24 family protein